MLTKVILEGALGKRFGREWSLAVNSAPEALKLIDANVPGVFTWIKANLKIYEKYRVICEYEDGRTSDVSEEEYALCRRAKLIRFIPIIDGAGGGNGVAQFIAGAILVVVGLVLAVIYPGNPVSPYLINAGIGLMLGGAIMMLTPQPKTDKNEGERKDLTSYYFDGPVNTTQQGVPVPLIYGEVITGSHPISATLRIDQLKD